MKTNCHNKTLSVLLTLVTTLAVVNITLFPYFGNSSILLLTNEFISDSKFIILLIKCIYFAYNRTVEFPLINSSYEDWRLPDEVILILN
jgi:hypothetical protein